MAIATVGSSHARLVVENEVAFVTLDAPPLNILTADLMRALTDAIGQARAEPGIKALVLRATEGSRAFSAGADVGEHRPENAPAMIDAFSQLFSALGAYDVPIIGVVDGAALGAGFELAMMTDILLASDRATFGQPEIRLGFFAPVGVAYLARRIGVGRAVEVTSTGRTYTAAEMHGYGLVTRVVPKDDLALALESVLADLRRASAAVLRMNVWLTRHLSALPFEEARRAAERVFVEELIRLEDVHEGVAAFVDKRQPVWRNR